MSDSDIIVTIKPLIAVFDKIGIAYYVGGSVASSAFGKARSTLDVDIVARIAPADVKTLVGGLKNVYYISEQAVLEAVRRNTSFNIVHLETIMKVDIFILKKRDYDQQAFNRKMEDPLDAENSEAKFFLAAPEDIILNKLEWYQAGGRVSGRQWGDVIGVLKVQADKINRDYLKHWANELGLTALLEKAFKEAR